MKAKSFLLTVPLAVSALMFLTFPANAVCWSWKPCADLQGYGYGAPTESQSVLPPLPQGGSVPPGSAAAPAPGATAAPGPAGSPEKLTPAEARGDGDRPASSRTGAGKAKAGTSAGTGKGGATSGRTGTCACSSPGQASRASARIGSRAGSGEGHAAAGTDAAASTHAGADARPGEGGAATCASSRSGSATCTGSGPGSPTTGTGAQTRSGLSAWYGAGHDAYGARHGDHAGDPGIGTARGHAPHLFDLTEASARRRASS